MSGKKRLDYDRRGIHETLEKLAVQGASAVVERQWARPGQGATAGFKLGQGYEVWLSALTFFKIPYLVVTPAAWKKALGLPGQEKSEDRKVHSIEMALKLFPSVDIVRDEKYSGKKLAKKYHDGKAEALLLTEYLRKR